MTKASRFFHVLALPALLFLLCILAGCKAAERPPRPGEPRKASPTEQISLYLAVSPSSVLESKFPGRSVSSLVSGGWGYTREDACVLHNPEDVGTELNRGYLDWTNTLIDIRNILEFTQTSPTGERLYVIDCSNYVQETIRDGDKRFLRVLYSVFTVTESQYRELVAWAKDPKVTEEMFASRVRDIAREREREFWFDITEPHAHNVKVRG